MDWYQLARINMQQISLNSDSLPATTRDALLAVLSPGLPGEGGDLIRFTEHWMVAESDDGLGNNRNYGVRNMVTDGDSLFIGTANPMNLDPLGGWELIELR